MRISDWSSDVCSSDLRARQQVAVDAIECAPDEPFDARGDEIGKARVIGFAQIMAVEIFELFEVEARRRAADMSEVEPFGRLRAADDFRSAESRVGKEGVSTCRSRWSPDH